MSKLKPQTSSLLTHEEFPFLFSVTSIREKISQSQSQSQSQNPQTESTLNPILSIRTQIAIFIFKKYKSLNQIKQLHAPLTTSGMLPYPWVSNNLLYKYLHFYDLPYARLLFDRMPERNLISWNSMITGYLQDGNFIHCLITFREMIESGMRPDHSTLISVIKACRNSIGFQMGRLVHCLALRDGLGCDVVCGRLVHMYARYGMIEDAKKLFDQMTIINIETWKMMIQIYAECGNVVDVLAFYARMRDEGFSPNEFVMKPVTKVDAVNKASQLRDYGEDINIAKVVSILKQDEHVQYVKKARQSFKAKHKSRKLQKCATKADKIQHKSIKSLQQAYKEHSEHVAQKLVADTNNLAIQPLKEMVDDLSGSAAGNKASLDRCVRTESLLKRWWMISNEVLLEIKLFWRDMFR